MTGLNNLQRCFEVDPPKTNLGTGLVLKKVSTDVEILSIETV